MTPEHTALFGYAFCVIIGPLMVLSLIATAQRHTRWFNYGFAIVLAALIVPLILCAPQVIGQLL